MAKYKELYEKAEEELAEAKAELTDMVDQIEATADQATKFIRSNAALIGGIAMALVVGFALGAALV